MSATTSSRLHKPDGVSSAIEGPSLHSGAADVTCVGPGRRRRARLRLAVINAAVGFVVGYAVVHPVAMSVFAWFAGRGADSTGGVILQHLFESFTLEMVPMGVAFGIFGLVVGALDGAYRSLVRLQRDDLAGQLAINREARRQLEEQYRALRELQREKQRMTRFLVHDLKNHVGCVLGYTDILSARGHRDGWPQRDLASLDVVRRQATRMQGAVHDLLMTAKLEHRVPLQTRRARVGDVVAGGVDAAALAPGEGSVETATECPPETEIACDAALLERVIANLVLNAVRHNRGDVTVRVSASVVGGEVEFRCADDGDGIPQGVCARLFEDFASGTAGDEPGRGAHSFGLGLAFCKAAVEAHGGRIRCETAPGRGATFVVSLPTGQE